MRALTALAAASLLVSTAASAVIVSFGGQKGSARLLGGGATDPIDSLITRFTNASDGSALPTETFYQPVPNIGQTCAANSSTSITTLGAGSTEFVNDSSLGIRYMPRGAGTCYAVANAGGDPQPGSISININGNTNALLYAGFLWGSADSWNYVKFIDTAGNEIKSLPITYNGAAFGSNATITGTDFMTQPGLTVDREQFINFVFTAKENVGAIEIGNTQGCCFEFANYTDSSTAVTGPKAAAAAHASLAAHSFSTFALAVPEPGAALALVAGLGMIGFARRTRA